MDLVMDSAITKEALEHKPDGSYEVYERDRRSGDGKLVIKAQRRGR